MALMKLREELGRLSAGDYIEVPFSVEALDRTGLGVNNRVEFNRQIS